jgi:hypothetical protein
VVQGSEAYAVQAFTVDVTTPADPDPDDDDSIEGYSPPR